MKPLIEQRPIISNTESKVFKLHNNSTVLRHLTQLVVTQQYSNPQLAAIREIVSNAYDANLEAQKQDGNARAVDITVLEDRVIVRDYGFGLSHEWMMDGYAAIANSTKHEDQDLIGAKGIGRLAPLAVSKQYFVTSYYNSTASTYCVFLNENSEIAISLWNQSPSKDPSGLEVTIICPNTQKDKDFHVSYLLECVYAVAEGSRHQVNLDLTALNDDNEYLWLNDYKVASVEAEDFTVDYYSIQKVGREGQIFIDLGGALYPVRCVKDLGKYNHLSQLLSNHTQSHVEKYKYYDQQLEASAGFNSFSITRSFPGTVIIRVSPDYLVLNTSREEILNTTEQQEKQKALVEKALAALEPVYVQKVQEFIQQDYSNWISEIQDPLPVERLRYLYKAVNGQNKAGFLRVNDSHILEFDLGDSWTCSATTDVVINNSYHLINLNGHHIAITAVDSHNGHSYKCDYYYLATATAQRSLAQALNKDQHTWGANKITPKATRRNSVPALTQALMLKAEASVVLVQDCSQPTLKQLEKFFKTSLQETPVMVINVSSYQNSVYDSLLEFMPLVNYLGIYTSDKEKPEAAPVSRVLPSVSLLMRQLKQSDVTRNQANVYTDISNEITPALLQEKVIYFNKERNWKGELAKNVPAKYLTDYHELAFYLTDNAYDRVKGLIAEGKCNWVDGDDLDTELATALYNDYGFLINFVGGSGYSDDAWARRQALSAICKSDLAEYLPDLTHSVAKLSAKTLEAFKAAYKERHRLELTLKEVTAKLFEPYVGEYPCDCAAMLGPYLSPYYNYFLSNYSMDAAQEMICKDIALRLKNEGANIRK